MLNTFDNLMNADLDYIDIVHALPYETRKKWFYQNLYKGKGPDSHPIDLQAMDAMRINRRMY